MQGKQVWSLLGEDPTCNGATLPRCHNHGARALELALEPMGRHYWACVLPTTEAYGPQSLRSARKSRPHSLQLEKAHTQQQRASANKNQ